MPVLFIWMIYYSKLALLKITNSWIEKQKRYAIKFCKETVFTGKMVMA